MKNKNLRFKFFYIRLDKGERQCPFTTLRPICDITEYFLTRMSSSEPSRSGPVKVTSKNQVIVRFPPRYFFKLQPLEFLLRTIVISRVFWFTQYHILIWSVGILGDIPIEKILLLASPLFPKSGKPRGSCSFRR